MSDNLRFLNPATLFKPPGYTQVVEATGPGRTVYVAGQLGQTPDGALAGDFETQAEQAFRNLELALAAVGGDLGHVVKITNYLTDIRYLPAFRKVRDRHFGSGPLPASTTMAITALAREGALFEIEAVAVLPPA